MNPVYERWKFCEQVWYYDAPAYFAGQFYIGDGYTEQVILSILVQHLARNGVHLRRPSILDAEHVGAYDFASGVETLIAPPSDFATAVENGMKHLMGATP